MSKAVFTTTYAMPPVCAAEILRYMGCKQITEEIRILLADCLAEILPQLTYKVCYREFAVSTHDSPLAECDAAEAALQTEEQQYLDLGFVSTDSTTLRRKLNGCTRLVLFAATVGIGPDRLIKRYGNISPSKALCFQAIGAERIESLCDSFCSEIGTRYASLGFAAKPRCSPGYGDFPLSVQRAIFQALDCPRKIGLSLNDSLLMTPSKSVTAIIGLQPEADSPYAASAICDSFSSSASSAHKCADCESIGCPYRQD